MRKSAFLFVLAVVIGLPAVLHTQSLSPIFDLENSDATVGGASPLSTSVRMGLPSIAATTTGTVGVQFYQVVSGAQGPNYSIQEFSDGAYTSPTGNVYYISNPTDAIGNSINLPSYHGIVNATIAGSFSPNLYYSLHFGCCDFSDEVQIKGAATNSFTCTQVGGNGNCYDGYYSGPPYLLIASDVTNLSALNQFESDGTTQIADGEVTLSGTVIVSASLNSNIGSQVQLQIEVEPANTPFSGHPTGTSEAVNPGTAATVTIPGLTPGAYHWRARSIDNEGGQSLWQSLSMNSQTVDFVVPVPQPYTYFLGNPGPGVTGVQQFRGYGSFSFAVPLGEWQGSTLLSTWYIGAGFGCGNSGVAEIDVVQGTDASLDGATTIYTTTALSASSAFLYFPVPLTFTDGDYYELIERCNYNGTWLSFGNSFNSADNAMGGIASDLPTLSNALNNGTLPPALGSIEVTTNLSTASFTVVGPVTYIATGASATFLDAPPASYTITFGPVPGYVTPASETATLVPGGSLAFTGAYSQIVVSPQSLTLPSTYVGASSASKSVIVTNESAGAVTMGTIIASQNFSASSSCTSVSPGKSCTIAVKFEPTGSGPLTGTLTINESSPSAQQTVSLSGFGYYRVSISPNPLPQFPDTTIGSLSTTECTTVTNNSASALTLKAISVSKGFVIAKKSTTCGGSLKSTLSCEECVQFEPESLGSTSGVLTFNTSLGAETVALSAYGISGGISPSTSMVVFPSTDLDSQSATKSVTLFNNTGGTVTFGTPTASTNFAVVFSSCVSPIASAKTCQVSVRFQPTAAGTLQGTLTINESSPLGTQSINLSGTGVNPKPTVNLLNPSSRAAGSAGFLISVTGSNFTTNSLVRWNGMGLATNYISSTLLTAQILSTHIDHQNTASVTVYNPSPGGGQSSPNSFEIVAPFSQRMLAYAPAAPTVGEIPLNQLAKLTHVIHHFLLLKTDGSGNLQTPTESWANKSIIDAEKASGLKVLISIGGGDASQAAAFSTVAASSKATQNFANQVASFVTEHDFDGVDIDWEFPLAGEKDRCTALMKALHEKLPSDTLLSMTVSPIPSFDPGVDLAALKEIVNFFNVMAYDYYLGTGYAGDNAALYPDLGRSRDVTDTIFSYVNTNQVLPEQLNIGIPFYGYEYPTVTSLGEKCTPNCEVEPRSYSGIAPLIGAGWSQPITSAGGEPYLLATDGAGVITYDDPTSIVLKAQYVLGNQQLGGIFVWELSQDDAASDLLDALYTSYLTYTQ